MAGEAAQARLPLGRASSGSALRGLALPPHRFRYRLVGSGSPIPARRAASLARRPLASRSCVAALSKPGGMD